MWFNVFNFCKQFILQALLHDFIIIFFFISFSVFSLWWHKNIEPVIPSHGVLLCGLLAVLVNQWRTFRGWVNVKAYWIQRHQLPLGIQNLCVTSQVLKFVFSSLLCNGLFEKPSRSTTCTFRVSSPSYYYLETERLVHLMTVSMWLHVHCALTCTLEHHNNQFLCQADIRDSWCNPEP